ncbi:MAG TPA: serine/threonine-protein kinase [Vicinamibacterales bacterium]|nr:serine/threonine-protein kinase [Vicinamibacterales bacterium]
MGLTPGTRLGPYEIVSPIGSGGMGEVYRARDSRLDRAVAVKVLPSHLAADAAARARFDREARSIAAVSHPNICALHDVGHERPRLARDASLQDVERDASGVPTSAEEEDKIDFLVMELLDGETMQDRLVRGPLEPGPLIDHAIALADALDVAHTHGLIHRDLKPANIFLTSRQVPKILDFGVAKALVEPAPDLTRPAGDALTILGTTVGTVAYMSPEQLRGEPLDARSDLFSFGLVLYEMATGQRAFTGTTSAVVSAAILGQEPAAPRSLRPDLPPRLEDAILKTLEKDRSLRCQTAAELRADLMRVKRGSSGSVPVPVGTPPAAAPPIASSAPAEPLPQKIAPERFRRGPRRALWLTLGLVIAFAARSYFWRQPDTPSTPPPVPSGAVPSAGGLRAPAGQTTAAAPIPNPPPPTIGPPPAPPPVVRAPDAPARGGPPAEPRPFVPPPPAATPVAPDAPPIVPDAGRRGPGGPPPGRAGRRGARGPFLQLQALSTMLRNFPPEKYDVVYAAGDQKSQELALQLKAAIDNGGWTAVTAAPIREPQAVFGIFVPRQTPGTGALINWARRAGLEPDVRLIARLPHVHIVVGRHQD